MDDFSHGQSEPTRAAKPRASRAMATPEPAPASESSGRRPQVRPAERPRFQRRKSRAMFPAGSITVLTVIAVAIWSYVAVRDMQRPSKGPAATLRLASEPASTGTGTTRR